MKTTLSQEGLLELPVEFRELDRIMPGQQFEIQRIRAGEYLLEKVSQHIR